MNLFNAQFYYQARQLLQAGHRADEQDAEGNTPIHVTQNPEVLALLLSMVPSPPLNKKGMHPVLCHTKYACLRHFSPADFNRVDAYGNTGLHLNWYDDPRSFSLFARHVNARNMFGATPVFMFSTLEYVRTLHERGADLCVKTSFGQTLLMYLLRNNAEMDVVKYVYLRVKNARDVDRTGRTLFHFAMRREHVEFLGSRMRDMREQTCNKDRTPLETAHNQEVADALKRLR